MESFTRLTAIAAALPAANIDTDMIFPARFLLLTEKTGLGRYAFYEWRYARGGAENPDFVLNQAPFRASGILVAGDNFGCGSSREHAPWALRDLGLRCVISTSFGEIFQSNCFKNGMLAVVVRPAELAVLQADAASGAAITVDLGEQEILRPSGERIAFRLEPWRREALLNGWDEIDLIINERSADIAAFETRQRAAKPWLYEGI